MAGSYSMSGAALTTANFVTATAAHLFQEFFLPQGKVNPHHLPPTYLLLAFSWTCSPLLVTDLALMMWLTLGHCPLAFSALGLGVHKTTHSHLLWPLLFAVGIWQLLAMPQDGECFQWLPTCASYEFVAVLFGLVLSSFRGVSTCPQFWAVRGVGT